jgi:hypothetical protein
MCFIGHDVFGLITKAVCCHYFAVFRIGPQRGDEFMPILGVMDTLRISLLLYPTRLVPVWLVIWGTVTAMLRQLPREPLAEFFERARNFRAPFILLVLCRHKKTVWPWLRLVRCSYAPSDRRMQQVELWLRCTVFSLLARHGWLI